MERTTSLRLSSPAEGVVRGLIGADYDMDNELLTYNVYRQGLGTPIYTTTVRSNFYTRPNIAFKDTGLTGGQTYNYRVAVSDPMGNNVTGDWTPVNTFPQRVQSVGTALAFWTMLRRCIGG